MTDQRIIDYVKSALSNNTPIRQIKDNLISKGWTEFDINQALDAATQERIFPKAPKHSRSAMIAILFIVIVSAGVLGFYIVNKKETRPIEAVPQFNPVKDCLENFDCFIQQAQSCKLSKLKFTTQPIDISGIMQTTTTFYETKGAEAGKCVLYVKTLQADANRQADIAEGLDGTCRLNANDLVAMLSKWKQGTFSSEDLKTEECEGTMFVQQP